MAFCAVGSTAPRARTGGLLVTAEPGAGPRPVQDEGDISGQWGRMGPPLNDRTIDRLKEKNKLDSCITSSFFKSSPKDVFIDFRERGRERERERIIEGRDIS